MFVWEFLSFHQLAVSVPLIRVVQVWWLMFTRLLEQGRLYILNEEMNEQFLISRFVKHASSSTFPFILWYSCISFGVWPSGVKTATPPSSTGKFSTKDCWKGSCGGEGGEFWTDWWRCSSTPAAGLWWLHGPDGLEQMLRTLPTPKDLENWLRIVLLHSKDGPRWSSHAMPNRPTWIQVEEEHLEVQKQLSLERQAIEAQKDSSWNTCFSSEFTIWKQVEPVFLSERGPAFPSCLKLMEAFPQFVSWTFQMRVDNWTQR